MGRDAQLREEILKLVEEYYQERFAGHPFNPGRDTVHYAGRVFDAFENVLNFFKVVAVFVIIDSGRIERGVHLDFDDVTEIVLWIKFPLAQVT